MSSLDILEECLERIYICRKHILAEKSKSFASKVEKRRLKRPSSRPTSSASSSRRHKTEERAEDRTAPNQADRKKDMRPVTLEADTQMTGRVVKPKEVGVTTGRAVVSEQRSIELSPSDLTATVIFDECRTGTARSSDFRSKLLL